MLKFVILEVKPNGHMNNNRKCDKQFKIDFFVFIMDFRLKHGL